MECVLYIGNSSQGRGIQDPKDWPRQAYFYQWVF